jgi:hypothetical protein
MASRSRRHIPRDNKRTRLKTEQATRTETRLSRGEGSEENWMLERDRLLAIIRDRKDDLLKRQQAKQAEKERLKREELEKQRLEKKQLEKKRKKEQRLEILSARQKERLREIAPQAARLSRWQQWVRRYGENLSAEGFTLSDGLWHRPINSDDIENTVTFKDAKAKKLSDIPIEFPYDLENPAYIYVSWDRIRYEHIWYSEREENLLDLGFDKKIDWGFTYLHWSNRRGFSSFQVPDFEDTVWGWPGADDNEHLYDIHPPEDFSPYQILDLAGFDKSLLDGFKEKQYRKDLNRLPSAQLGDPRDPLLQWMRQFAEVEIHHRIEKNRRTPPTQPLFVLKPPPIPDHVEYSFWAPKSWGFDDSSFTKAWLACVKSEYRSQKPWSRADMNWWGMSDEAIRTSKCLEMLVHFLFLT